MKAPTVDFTRKRKLAMRSRAPRMRYMQGFCGEFAIAASLLTGFPIVVLYERGSACGFHAMLLHKNKLYDVKGWQTWRQVRREWKGFPIARVKRWPIHDMLHMPGWDVQMNEVVRAMRYLRRYR